jgi:hypothetical protein
MLGRPAPAWPGFVPDAVDCGVDGIGKTFAAAPERGRYARARLAPQSDRNLTV